MIQWLISCLVVTCGLIFAAYIIFRYRSIDIQVLFQRGTLCLVSVVLVAVIFFSIEFIIEKSIYNNDEVVDILSATVGAFAFLQLKGFFEDVTDRIFFKGHYEYSSAVLELSTLLNSAIELDVLLDALEGFINRTIKPTTIEFFVGDLEHLGPVHGATTVPIIFQEQVNAVLVIGEKKCGGRLSPRDTALLAVISRQAGIAMHNAKLYGTLKDQARELEHRVEERTERIKVMYDAQSKFLAEMSHEFQTPIAILKMNLEALKTDQQIGGGAGQKNNACYVMETTLDRLSRLTQGLLDIARLNFSKERFERKRIDVAKLLSDAHDDCLALAEDKGITLSVASDAIVVRGDRDKLKEVLLNLLSNALKHTPGGGSVSLRAVQKEREVEIIIADTGRGIAAKNIPRLFERFYRIQGGPPSPYSSLGGTGLGLHLCRRIIEAHGGTIVAESKIGQGSQFVIHLPAE